MHEKIKLLDHGFVRLVEHMGSDLSIVRNARVSYDSEWLAGVDQGSDTRLINYLYKNGHNTPFECVVFTFDVKAPIFVFRQWHRHRTQCLSGDTRLKFARPCDGKPYWKTLKELSDQWNSPVVSVKRPDKQNRTLRDFKRDTIVDMKLFCIEDGCEIALTNIIDVIESGKKEVFKIVSDKGDEIKASKDHRFLTVDGWKILEKLVVGDKIKTISKVADTSVKDSVPFTETEIEEELWKNSKYKDIRVSNLGRITRRSLFVSPTLTSVGRLIVSIKDDNKWITIQVSRLVADTFIEGSGHVLHKDDCTLNNRVSNLKYGNDQDNHNDALLNGRRAFNNVTFMSIISIESVGVEETFDIEVDHPDHNFIADNFCTHNSYNELSARYRELPEEFYVPEPHLVGKQNKDNKQMRDPMTKEEWGVLSTSEKERVNQTLALMRRSNTSSFSIYKAFLKEGVPRELARSVLPVATYSHMFATVNLHNLFNFLRERMHPHAQYEIMVYAKAILELIRPLVPVATEAFEKSLKKGV